MSATVCTQVTKTQAPVRRPGLFKALASRIQDWRRVAEERRSLARLEDRDLQDLSLSRWDIEREIARHLWDIN